MSFEIFEGSWEELKSHEAELVGRQVRLTVLPDTEHQQENEGRIGRSDKAAKPLQGLGLLSGAVSSEAYLREKRVETEREDRPIL